MILRLLVFVYTETQAHTHRWDETLRDWVRRHEPCRLLQLAQPYSPSAQDINWYHLGGGGKGLLCLLVTYMSLKLENT